MQTDDKSCCTNEAIVAMVDQGKALPLRRHTSPCKLTNGPPELPLLIAASV